MALSTENFCEKQMKQTFVQLNKYETDPYLLQIFQSNTSVCLIIPVFCKICELNTEHESEPEIVLKILQLMSVGLA